jgi:hypothetical protein
MAPFEFPAAPQTFDLNRTRKRNVILVASMLAVMILALGGLLIFLNLGQGNPAIIPPPTPNAPVITPPTPPIPPIPPSPPPPGIEIPKKIDSSLIYPGSRKTMTITTEGFNNVLKLHSDDAASKVVKWYTSRLKVTDKFSIVGQTVLQAGDTNVVIMGGDDGAEIRITQSNKDSKK